MSRISPFHFNIEEYSEQEIQNICPRYIKWLKKVRAFDFSKRRKGKVERTMPTYEGSHRYVDTSIGQKKKSRGFLSKIRKGGQNLRVRLRTSADLWRRWIRGGIMYNTELIEADELELENIEKVKEIKPKVEIIIVSQPSEETKVTEEVSNISATTEKIEEKSNEKQNIIETEVKIETIEDGVSDTKDIQENQSIIEENPETKVNTEPEDTAEIKDTTDTKDKPENEEKTETEDNTETEDKTETEVKPENCEQISEAKGEENRAISIADSNSSVNNSTPRMPEVVAND